MLMKQTADPSTAVGVTKGGRRFRLEQLLLRELRVSLMDGCPISRIPRDVGRKRWAKPYDCICVRPVYVTGGCADHCPSFATR